jgi:hypothetical protein
MSEQPDTTPATDQPGALSRWAHRAEEAVEGVVDPAVRAAETAAAETAAVVSKADTALQADLQDHTGTAFSLYQDVLAKINAADPKVAAELAELMPKVLTLAAGAARITSGVLGAV